MNLTRKEIESAITFGHGLCGRNGFRRVNKHCGYLEEESERDALAREARLIFADHYQPDWLWGRESWCTRKPADADLIAWTVDGNGRIVRGWRMNSLDRAATSLYHPHGDRFCPIEAAWLPSVQVGEISLPAYPFLVVASGSTDPEAIATVQRLNVLRPEAVALELEELADDLWAGKHQAHQRSRQQD